MNLLEIRNVSLGHGKRCLVRELSWSLQVGERVLIVGENGAGKSTLLHGIAGALAPQIGSISLQANDLYPRDERSWQSARAPIAYVPQQPVFIDALSVHENLTCFTRNAVNQQLNQAVNQEAELSAAQLEPRRRVALLSGGERARLALLIALLQNPKLLVLNEPTAHLSDVGVNWMLASLAKLAQSVSVVAATHDPRFVLANAQTWELAEQTLRVKHATEQGDL